MMKKMKIMFPIITLILILIVSPLHAQAEPDEEIVKILELFEKGMNSGEVDKFSNYFISEMYLSFDNGITGYFSQDQSYYLLLNYLKNIKPIGFNVSMKNMRSQPPYLMGVMNYSKRGVFGSFQVFITLKKVAKGWRISQLTID